MALGADGYGRADGIDGPVTAPWRHELGAVFCGGALGTLARAGLAEGLPHRVDAWPWPTLAVNLLACALLGWVAVRLRDVPARPFWATGVCGGLSTFSTLQVELVEMADAGAWGLAVAYAAVSVAGGLALVAVAAALARRTAPA